MATLHRFYALWSLLLTNTLALSIFANSLASYGAEPSHQTVADELLAGYPVGFYGAEGAMERATQETVYIGDRSLVSGHWQANGHVYPFGENKVTASLALN